MFERVVATLKRFDLWLVGAIGVLMLLGALIQYSLSIEPGVVISATAARKLIYLLLAVGVFGLFSALNYRSWIVASWVYPLLIGIALVAVLVFGTELKGTTGWIIVGPISIQPVEIVKLLFICFCAAVMKHRNDSIARIPLHDVLIIGAVTLGTIALIFLQPDLGSASIIGSIWLFFLLMARAPRWCIAVVITGAVLFAVLGWFFVFEDFQKDRLSIFLNLEDDSLGKGYNITQSIIAVGSGGLWGKGFGEGTQSQLQFLPEASSDFAFAVVAEEFGLVGAGAVLLALGVICWRLVRIMRQTQDTFAFFFLGGVVSYLVVQSTIVVGMNIGVMPVTGLPLPFISSGGSSLLVTSCMLGIAHSMRIHE